jgi:hypothetical protein
MAAAWWVAADRCEATFRGGQRKSICGDRTGRSIAAQSNSELDDAVDRMIAATQVGILSPGNSRQRAAVSPSRFCPPTYICVTIR